MYNWIKDNLAKWNYGIIVLTTELIDALNEIMLVNWYIMD